MSAVIPLKESSRALIIEVARALQAHYAEITARWRTRVAEEFGFDPRTLAALRRLTIDTGCSYFCQGDFESFFENVSYFARRLAKLDVDTRAVVRALEIYQELSEPYLCNMGSRLTEAVAAMEMLRSATFNIVAGAYFDEKTAESEALLKILDAELLARNLRALLQQVLEITTRTFGASVGGLVLKDVDSDLLGLQASVGLEVEDYGVSLKIGQGFSGAIAANGEPDIVLDTDRDDRIVSETLRRKCKTLWGVPLITPGGTQGVMIIGFEKPYFEWLPKERALMRALGERSALAIERARMMDALREREALIADLSGHLLRGQEDERRRISRELHDETGQALMVIRLYLGMLEPMVRSGAAREKIRETVEVVDRTVEGLRRMIGKLSPLVLEELGLVAALRKEAKDLAKTAGIAAKVSIDENVGRLGPEKETAIYRIVQEALHNVAKHAKAQNVTVALSRENTDVRVVIQDDGVGMGMALSQKSQVGGQSFGLAGIKERVKTFGGTVRIVSVKGEGTRIEVVIPATEQRLPEPVGQPYLVHSSDRTPMQETGTGKPLMLSAKV